MDEYRGILDLGTEEQKAKLFQFDELVSSPAAPTFPATEPSKWRVWARRDQDGSSSCVWQAVAKAATILRDGPDYSAAAYARRSNKPAEGTYPIEAFEVWRKEGVGLEAVEPSQRLSEAAMNALTPTEFAKQVAFLSRVPAYVGLPAYDFDKLCSTLQATGKPIPVGFFATYQEWNRDIPAISNPSLTLGQASVRHEVCATPNVGTWNGQQGFTIEDSWGDAGIDGTGVRFITRAFFEKRNCIPGLYATRFSLQEAGPVKPKYNFTKDLELGMSGHDVKMLQDCLKYEGLFPANHPGSDYFGNITKDAVQKFQVKHSIAGPGSAGYGRCGPLTRAKLNALFS